jgi:hypothetical protein
VFVSSEIVVGRDTGVRSSRSLLPVNDEEPHPSGRP